MPTDFTQSGSLSPRLLQEALDIINISNFGADPKKIGHRILETLFRIVSAESSVLFLSDENETITTSIVKNLCGKKSAEFVDYFCRLDPLNLVHGAAGNKSIFRIEEAVDHSAFLYGEYYNDFYKPQNIYHKLVIKLQTKNRLYGEICLHRSSSARNFSDNEIIKLQTVIPYFVHALEHNELRRNVRFKDSLLNIIDNNLSTGVIILDDSLKLVYINKRAREFSKSLFGTKTIQTMGTLLPPVLMEDCQQIKHDLKDSKNFIGLPKNRVLQNSRSEKYHVTSRLIDETFSKEHCDLFLISLEKISDSKKINTNGMKETYQLTDREAEIATLVFKGLKNAEIAQKLFVSEITVKWHIRNLFEKVGVKTRTALIHRILSKEPSHTPKIENIVV